MLREKESRALKKFSDFSYTLGMLKIKYIYLELQHMMRNAALLLLFPRTTFFRYILFTHVWNLFIPHSWLLTEFSSVIKRMFWQVLKKAQKLRNGGENRRERKSFNITSPSSIISQETQQSVSHIYKYYNHSKTLQRRTRMGIQFILLYLKA